MGEVTLRHQIVSLKDTLDVGAVDTDSDTHQEVLWPLGYAAIKLQQIGTLKSLESEAADYSSGRW